MDCVCESRTDQPRRCRCRSDRRDHNYRAGQWPVRWPRYMVPWSWSAGLNHIPRRWPGDTTPRAHLLGRVHQRDAPACGDGCADRDAAQRGFCPIRLCRPWQRSDTNRHLACKAAILVKKHIEALLMCGSRWAALRTCQRTGNSSAQTFVTLRRKDRQRFFKGIPAPSYALASELCLPAPPRCKDAGG